MTDGPHLRQVPPRSAPGGLYVRIVTDTDVVLGVHPLLGPDTGGQGTADAETASVWLELHPAACVYTYVYDGDSGECLQTFIVGDGDR